MVKTLHFLIQIVGWTPRYQTFFEKLNPDDTHGTSDMQTDGPTRRMDMEKGPTGTRDM